MMNRAVSTGVSPSTMAVLMLSVFTVLMGYGTALPMLPHLIERLLGAGRDATQVSRSTGLLTGLYALSLFLFAPVWGHLSDRYGRRSILLIGLVGFSATMSTFGFIENLPAAYTERFLSGAFAAAVMPAAMATIGDLAATEEARARGLSFLSMAGISGFLLGPMFGVFIAGAANVLPVAGAPGSLAVPLAGIGALAILAAIAGAITIPGRNRGYDATNRDPHALETAPWLVLKLLSLTFIVAAGGVGVFHVGLALGGKSEIALTQYQIAWMFSECSVVMFVAQALVFSRWVKPETTRWFIAPALAVLASGLFFVPYASNFVLMLAVVATVGASAGILAPILTYWISSKAGKGQGAQLGKQTAATNLGVAAGSAAGGELFDFAPLPHAPFLLMTVLTVLGILLSLRLPKRLLTLKFSEARYVDDIEKAASPGAPKSGA